MSASSPGYTIMPPQPDDAAELARMHYDAWLATYPNDELGISVDYIERRLANRLTREGIATRRGYIEESYTNPAYFLRIARDEAGRIVGFIDGREHSRYYELSGLYTAQATYGTGLGALLWQAYAAWAMQPKEIRLTVASYNGRARAFYRKCGFRDVPGSSHYFSETIIPVVDMVRPSSSLLA